MKHEEQKARTKWIAEAAYFLAQARGFKPGYELDDWLKAKQQHAEMTIAYYFKVIEEDKAMVTIANLRLLADSLGIKNAWCIQTEKELILSIQKASQHLACFRTRKIELCEASGCRWKSECRKLVAAWMR